MGARRPAILCGLDDLTRSTSRLVAVESEDDGLRDGLRNPKRQKNFGVANMLNLRTGADRSGLYADYGAITTIDISACYLVRHP